MTYDILQTGSKGNAMVINNQILIDCGVPFKKLNLYYKNIALVLLTHQHCDHFNKSTIKRLAKERPTLRFACGKFLVSFLQECGVRNIDILENDHTYGYGICTVTPVRLVHNVECFGYKIILGDEKIFYATDTNSLEHISASNFDYYFVEANYEDEEIMERIAEKEVQGMYAYEHDVLNNHLSKAKCDAWLEINKGDHSKITFMHKHGGGIWQS